MSEGLLLGRPLRQPRSDLYPPRWRDGRKATRPRRGTRQTSLRWWRSPTGYQGRTGYTLGIAILGLLAKKHGLDDRAHEVSRKILLRIGRDGFRQHWDNGQSAAGERSRSSNMFRLEGVPGPVDDRLLDGPRAAPPRVRRARRGRRPLRNPLGQVRGRGGSAQQLPSGRAAVRSEAEKKTPPWSLEIREFGQGEGEVWPALERGRRAPSLDLEPGASGTDGIVPLRTGRGMGIQRYGPKVQMRDRGIARRIETVQQRSVEQSDPALLLLRAAHPANRHREVQRHHVARAPAAPEGVKGLAAGRRRNRSSVDPYLGRRTPPRESRKRRLKVSGLRSPSRTIFTSPESG